jgi:hypothetical protein
MKRRGFMLMEMLSAVLVLSAFLIAVTPLLNSLISDVPRSREMLESHTVLDQALERLGRDVGQATSVSLAPDANETDQAAALLAALPEGVVRYEFDGEHITRKSADGAGDDADAMVWNVPQASINWRLWRRDGRVVAVEVRAWYERTTGDTVIKSLEQGYVFFVGSAPKGGVKP